MRRVSFGLGLFVAAIAACNGATPASGPTASPTGSGDSVLVSPSPSFPWPSSSATPTIAPTTSAASQAIELKVGSIATVVTDGLRVRSRPEVSDVSRKLTPLLKRGQPLFIVDGPVAGSGYRWYQVQPIGGHIYENGEAPFGWVAAGDKTGEPWIAPGAFPRCPRTPTTFSEVSLLEPFAGLACLSRQPLSFDARIATPRGGTCPKDPLWIIKPDWLIRTCMNPEFSVYDPKSQENSFFAVIEPRVDTSGLRPGAKEHDWINVTVTGHFDDPAASTCHLPAQNHAIDRPSDEEIVLRCRDQFVITGIERTL